MEEQMTAFVLAAALHRGGTYGMACFCEVWAREWKIQ
jgi:hypothetical protein